MRSSNLRALAILLTLCLLLAALAGCAAPAEMEQPSETETPAQTTAPQEPVETESVPGLSFAPGTYTGTGNGHNGPVTVETTVDESSIVSVKVVTSYESAGVRDALTKIPEAIVEKQSLAVDTLSGATFCSNAILYAVEDCLTQAGGDIEALKQTEEAEDPAQELAYEADVIVVGAGGAGLASAVSAHQNGASVIVVEELGIIGGSTVFSGGAFNAADPERQQSIEMAESNVNALMSYLEREPHDEYEAQLQETVKQQYQEHVKAGNTWLFDSAELHMLQTYADGDYEGNPELITLLCQNALPAIQWIEGLGGEFQSTVGMATGAIWKRSHYGEAEQYPDGFVSVAVYENYIESHEDAEIQLNTKAQELLTENGRVVGVKAVCGNDTVIYTAKKGVVLATGGFGGNVEMRQQYNILWDNLDSSVGCSNQCGSQGDGIVMGQAAGAQLVDMGLIQLHPNGDTRTGKMMGHPATFGLNRIFVNSDGNRFVAEDSRRDVLVNAIYGQEGQFMWVVSSAVRYPEGDTTIENAVALGNALKGDTVAELAEKMGVNAENLQKSIDQYNAIVNGAEDPLGLTSYDKELGDGPFYAAKRIPTVHHTMGGLKIDTRCRVLDEADQPIAGLYAAGEVTGDIHGANRLGGNAICDVNVFGRIAGETVVKDNQ